MALFGANASDARVFQAGYSTVTIGGQPAVATSVTVQIQRTLQPVITLTHGVMWSGGPAQGSVTADSIIFDAESKKVVTELADTGKCTKHSVVLDMKNACDSSNVKITISDAYCTSVSFTANGQQGYVGTQLVMQFTAVNVE